jgi:hypothetical protein
MKTQYTLYPNRSGRITTQYTHLHQHVSFNYNAIRILPQHVSFNNYDTLHIVHIQVWPGTTAYPDFTNPATVDYWTKSAKDYHDQIPFDGLWTVCTIFLHYRKHELLWT